jgi:hypothetical protein
MQDEINYRQVLHHISVMKAGKNIASATHISSQQVNFLSVESITIPRVVESPKIALDELMAYVLVRKVHVFLGISSRYIVSTLIPFFRKTPTNKSYTA